ncbi:MAG: SGNH/GDSL hydrolase family protein, partial [Bacteroidota bacterium]|nr:SGNH/GDSL hydrolase family protein [Bacteroidota bacterium]
MKWLFLLYLPLFSTAQNGDTMHHTYSYLAFGDSYTIGEGLLLHQNFPYQTVSLLRKEGYDFSAPEIIAKTGWTTGDLEAAIQDHTLSSKYDFVSLLIGVNNQYRGQNILEYKNQFERLLKKSIALANNKPDHVLVISIPDYSFTPFGQALKADKITKEIDEYNTLNKALSIQYKTHYTDITDSTRKIKNNPSLVASDGLHPSAKEYEKWAKKLVEIMKAQIK